MSDQTQLQNVFASVGDLFFVIHDWLFTEEILRASLMMPIAIQMMYSEEDVRKKAMLRAERIVLACRIIFYSLTASWFLLSVITGEFLWRMSINLLFLYVTAFFLVSLCKIRSMIQNIDVS